jgi:hypothetical protein
MAGPGWEAMASARRRADLSMAALYLRYVALGGAATAAQLGAHVAEGGALTALEHDIAVHAINERFLELDDPDRLPYEVGDPPK